MILPLRQTVIRHCYRCGVTYAANVSLGMRNEDAPHPGCSARMSIAEQLAWAVAIVALVVLVLWFFMPATAHAQECPNPADFHPAGACHYTDAGDPDPSCTPGAILTDDLAVICGQSTKERRCSFDKAVRRADDAAYAVDPDDVCEQDHRVSLELGGSNEAANVWPQTVGCKLKDAVEDRLHADVCAGRMSLQEARAIILGDWRTFAAGMKTAKKHRRWKAKP